MTGPLHDHHEAIQNFYTYAYIESKENMGNSHQELNYLCETCSESTAGKSSSEGDIRFGLAIGNHGFGEPKE